MTRKRFAGIAVLAQLGRAGGLFTYRIPESLEETLHPGSLVQVPFANRRLQGLVWNFADSCDLPKVRDVQTVLDPCPVITPSLMQLADWISGYYYCPLSDVVAAMVPHVIARKNVYVLEMATEQPTSRLSANQRRLLGLVAEAGQIDQDEMIRKHADVASLEDVNKLVRRGILVRSSRLGTVRAKERTERIAAITPTGEEALRHADGLVRAPKQREILRELNRRGALAADELRGRLGCSSSVLASLAERKYIELRTSAVLRSPLPERSSPTEPLALSAAQQEAHDVILASMAKRGRGAFLLHGVTGSGKTEVYLQLMADALAAKRQTIMMVPEISLTIQAIERVVSRFPERVAVIHSRLSDGERLDEWQRIRSGKADVVVGPRSALFAPLPNLGLIIVDEEHDASYKQDSSPRYNARDAAAVLGKFVDATVIFGSATPDVATYHAAVSGRIRHLSLPDRPVWPKDGPTAISPRPMPPVQIVDMRQELKSGNRSIFSEALLCELRTTLHTGQQSLLFLNRRGAATIVICRDCGYVARCPSCDLPFTYHSAISRLICHRCDRRSASPRTCPACEGQRIRYLGVGTQRVEEEINRFLPGARVLRWDRDVTAVKGAHERIISAFARHEADILVGTQMIAKGLDFPLVTLVGVVSADTGLHLPDFRAPERSFQLLTQVAGRAGRSSLPSRVIVQTYTPDHYALQAAKNHDYQRFYEQEMSFRSSAGYPPFARLARFVISAGSESDCRDKGIELSEALRGVVARADMTGTQIIGPSPCYVARLRDRYYWHIIARSSDVRGLTPLLADVPEGWATDVDPVDLL